jgi:hypothetical protein
LLAVLLPVTAETARGRHDNSFARKQCFSSRIWANCITKLSSRPEESWAVGPSKEMKNGASSATGLHGSAALPFVIPSEVEGSAVQRTSHGNVFRQREGSGGTCCFLSRALTQKPLSLIPLPTKDPRYQGQSSAFAGFALPQSKPWCTMGARSYPSIRMAPAHAGLLHCPADNPCETATSTLWGAVLFCAISSLLSAVACRR